MIQIPDKQMRAGYRRDRSLDLVLVLFIGALIGSGYLLFTKPEPVSEIHATLGLLICWVGLVPSFEYLRRQRRPAMPLMPMTGIYYAIAFGVPSFRDTTWELGLVQVSSRGLLLALGGLGAFYAAYLFFDRAYGKGITPAVLPDSATNGRLRPAIWILLAVHLAFAYIAPLRQLPSLGQFFNGGGLLAFGMLFWRYLERRLGNTEACCFALSLVAAIVPRIASGSLWQVLDIGLFLAIVFWVKRDRVPWVWLAVFLSLIAILQVIKPEYRVLTWGDSARYADAGPLEKVGAFAGLASEWLENRSALDTADQSAESINKRASMIAFLSYVTDQTPEVVPYWLGESYINLFYKLVPRLLWPDKPVENLGYSLSARYGMRDLSDETTSMNVPWVVELYANFGSSGVLIGMGLFGTMFAFLERKLNQPAMPTLSLIAGITILHDLWFQESNFSLKVGGVALMWASYYVYFWLVLGPALRSSGDPGMRVGRLPQRT